MRIGVEREGDIKQVSNLLPPLSCSDSGDTGVRKTVPLGFFGKNKECFWGRSSTTEPFPQKKKGGWGKGDYWTTAAHLDQVIIEHPEHAKIGSLRIVVPAQGMTRS